MKAGESPSGGRGVTPIDVVLVEDNEIFRETLELLLDVTPDMRVVAAVGDGPAALDACRRVEPNVVLMDYRLPGLDGVETTAGIRAACPETAVVVLTAAAEPGKSMPCSTQAQSPV